jgi:4-hydroxy-tetrahydrodipicolinate reductase
MKTDPYRIIVWGPGAVGKAGLRELVKRPEFEIVAVLGYSPSKIGKDVGDLIGHAPIGVKVTDDKAAIFAMEADCVMYTGTWPIDGESMEDDLIRILESGKNIVTAASHHYPQFHDKAYMDRLEAACRKGNSSIHGSGENPGFWFERVALTLTGLCTEVEHLKLEEFVDVGSGGTSPEVLSAGGFNMTVEQASAPGPANRVWETYYFVETLTMVSQALFNRRPDRIERTSTFHVSESGIELSQAKGDLVDWTIEKGKVGAITHSMTAYLDGKPRLEIDVNWYLKRENAPFPVKDDHYWRIRLEGKPVSLDCEFSAFATLSGNHLTHPGDPTPMTWYITVMPLIQAIPIVCAHEPGVVLPSVFAHTVPDFRLLEGRSSVVG